MVKIPRVRDLKRAYDKLQHQEPTPASERDLALYSQWARFDARLGEIWVQVVFEHWKELNPLKLGTNVGKQPWPAAIGVLLEFVGRALSGSRRDARLFSNWKNLVTEGIAKADWQQFFIGQRRIGGAAMFDDARLSLEEYRKWGFLSREVLFNKQQLPKGGRRTHSLAPETRHEILKTLLESSERLTTEEYWNAIGRVVSRRQAERDLERSPILSGRGRTRGRTYVRI